MVPLQAGLVGAAASARRSVLAIRSKRVVNLFPSSAEVLKGSQSLYLVFVLISRRSGHPAFPAAKLFSCQNSKTSQQKARRGTPFYISFPGSCGKTTGPRT